VIYVGIDDTDTKDAPGTNKLARSLIGSLQGNYQSVVAIRHQLLFDPRVPYTSKNSSASILFMPRGSGSLRDLATRIRRGMMDRFVQGSDPGLCVTDHVPEAITEFGRRCQTELVSQQEARLLAAREKLYLEGLGGSDDGVIGALAAVGLAAGGNDGRVVNIGHWPDDLCGPQEVAVLRARGVAEVRCIESDRTIANGTVDIGKRLRPNRRNGRIVLFVRPSSQEEAQIAPWSAVRLT